MTRVAVTGGALLLSLVITVLAPRSADATALSFLVLGPKPAPGQHGVYAHRLRLVVYGAPPDGACLVPVASAAGGTYRDARAAGSHRDARASQPSTALHAFQVSQLPIFSDMYLLRTATPLESGDWVL